jgi:sialate O-acetylesterase
MKHRQSLISSIFIVSVTCSSAWADVVPASVFTDHMVLQREKPVAIWGTADAGEKVSVAFAGQTRETVADADGKWKVSLDALQTAREGSTLTITGKNVVTLNDVLVGEVWLCSGQSNMEWRLALSRDGEKESAAANHPSIRLFNVSPKKKAATQPQAGVEAKWEVCAPESAKSFSAVGYYFGRHLQEKLDGVPIGLINSSWGGMPAEAFTPVEKLAATPELSPMLDEWAKHIANHPEAMKKYDADREAWKKAADEARATSQPVPREPARPPGPNSPNRPGNLWNGLLHPLVPYTLRGAIWYQGESNAGKAAQYRVLLPTMIASWREACGQGDFPFLVVQLANYMAPTDDANKQSNWAQLRESQRLAALNTTNVGLAVIIDIGEEKDIHPRNKFDVGTRLARLALVDTYGVKDLLKQGPTPHEAQFGSRVAIKFDFTGSGLKAKDGSLEKSFAVAGEDGVFKWADAKIDGDIVYVGSPDVPTPVAVRYAWADNPKATLFNSDDLPATPFELRRP